MDDVAHRLPGPPQQFDNPRDRHLFGKGPKKLLALDGGGVRGAITVAFLERIERLLTAEQNRPAAAEERPQDAPHGNAPQRRKPADETTQPHPQQRQQQQQQQGETVRLGDWFDLVGGTSTGAIIAGALALGHTTSEIKDFYLRLAPRVFRRPFWRVPGLRAKFDARALSAEINGIVKDRTLDSPDLITGLAIIAKRLDTGSPWILANNKNARYWDDPDDASYIGNKHYKLANLVRASTAAPHYFDPEILPIMEDVPADPFGAASPNLTNLPILSFLLSKLRAQYYVLKGDSGQDRRGLFVDGGVTPFNNPTLALLMMTALKPFGICWQLRPEHLTIVSVGTGTYRTKVSFANVAWGGPLGVTLGALLSLMSDNEYLALTQMQWLGECLTHWPINSEIKDLRDDSPPHGKWFRFARYDMRLERDWLYKNLGIALYEKEVARLRRMDDPGIIGAVYALARLAAEKQVKREHFFPESRPAAQPGNGRRP